MHVLVPQRLCGFYDVLVLHPKDSTSKQALVHAKYFYSL